MCIYIERERQNPPIHPSICSTNSVDRFFSPTRRTKSRDRAHGDERQDSPFRTIPRSHAFSIFSKETTAIRVRTPSPCSSSTRTNLINNNKKKAKKKNKTSATHAYCLITPPTRQAISPRDWLRAHPHPAPSTELQTTRIHTYMGVEFITPPRCACDGTQAEQSHESHAPPQAKQPTSRNRPSRAALSMAAWHMCTQIYATTFFFLRGSTRRCDEADGQA